MVHFSLPATLLFLATTVLAYNETVYLIRHGEKPADGSNGLSAQGEDRAQCLRNVFGSGSAYNIGYVSLAPCVADSVDTSSPRCPRAMASVNDQNRPSSRSRRI